MPGCRAEPLHRPLAAVKQSAQGITTHCLRAAELSELGPATRIAPRPDSLMWGLQNSTSSRPFRRKAFRTLDLNELQPLANLSLASGGFCPIKQNTAVNLSPAVGYQCRRARA